MSPMNPQKRNKCYSQGVGACPFPRRNKKEKEPQTFGKEQKRREVLCFLELAVSLVGYVLANTDAAASFHCLGSSRSVGGIGTKDTHSRSEKKAGAWENKLHHSEDFKHQSWKTTGINWVTSKGGCLGHVFYLNSMQGAHFKIFIKPIVWLQVLANKVPGHWHFIYTDQLKKAARKNKNGQVGWI